MEKLQVYTPHTIHVIRGLSDNQCVSSNKCRSKARGTRGDWCAPRKIGFPDEISLGPSQSFPQDCNVMDSFEDNSSLLWDAFSLLDTRNWKKNY